uniref:Outer membrane protein beta-barrel domain-containing protein n=1 Tax=uncultured nuHF2 cluster bacterium HF0770_13K08 TaxID=723591 RepID=E7C724_9BACT|nr:hypothetical protein [uncultured nuHF2 cluster bacterium HF0770_13K08]
MRYEVLLLTLFILSGSFSLVLAQSMYQFKRKSTNVGQHNMDTYTNNSSVISEDSQNIKLTPKIRFRYLYGTFNSDSQEATRSTSSIIWDGLGIGQSVFKYKVGISDDTIDLENTSIDLSYTFGDEYTLTLGSSAIYSGKLTVTTSDSEIYNSSNVEGSGYFSILGIEYGIFEILLGYQYIRYAFIEIESESESTSTYWRSFRDSGSQYATGIGLVF